ncbi:hypothetical protein [Dictyobacter aurantiacus]|uniref:Uncharacterized protein n=1 Tax=Dictyobacter aurantiacus TaxID=1936993 RepID=A0A401Z9J7_9CHLR|nr:hypothetical protein [Dictyobacter aurantiacus]GCE03544.1 hypothetical protein KDAU_08730 [Dictyobacter aurantiacus]
MRTQSVDTSPEFERIQIARIRAFSVVKKFTSIRSWTQSMAYANLLTQLLPPSEQISTVLQIAYSKSIV